jgi:hypothetical protein
VTISPLVIHSSTPAINHIGVMQTITCDHTITECTPWMYLTREIASASLASWQRPEWSRLMLDKQHIVQIYFILYSTVLFKWFLFGLHNVTAMLGVEWDCSPIWPMFVNQIQVYLVTKIDFCASERCGNILWVSLMGAV